MKFEAMLSSLLDWENYLVIMITQSADLLLLLMSESVRATSGVDVRVNGAAPVAVAGHRC